MDAFSLLDRYAERVQSWMTPLVEQIITGENVLQLALGVAIIFASILVQRRIERPIQEQLDIWLPVERHRVLHDSLLGVLFPLVWLLVQSFAILLCGRIGLSNNILQVVSVLLFAWIIIRLSAGLVSSPFWAKLIAIIAWGFAALNILDLLAPTIAYLDQLSFSIGRWHISVLGVIKTIIMMTFMLWLAISSSRTIEKRIRKSSTLTPSMQELSSKLLKVSFIFLATIIGLTSVGVDLTAFAVFGGALGVGLGFGLQRIVANLMGGLVLLMDRSIKPGDVIEIEDNQGSYGWVNALGARFVSVITRDGKEHLIPNEDLITRKVINWSYSDTNVRIKVPVNVAYSSDVNLAMNLMVEAAMETPRVLESPAPRCLIIEFGENAVQLELRIWACDPHNGVANLRSAVLQKVWNKFHEHGIRFPYPQRDLHLDIAKETIQALAEHFGNEAVEKSASQKPKAKPRATAKKAPSARKKPE